MNPNPLRRLLITIAAGDWCGQCQFLEMTGVPDERDRVPHCRLFAMRLRRAAAGSMGVLRLGECVAAGNKARAEGMK